MNYISIKLLLKTILSCRITICTCNIVKKGFSLYLPEADLTWGPVKVVTKIIYVIGLLGKESTCSARDPGSVSGLGRSPGERNKNPLQDSCLENPMDRGVWWATVHGVTGVEHDLVTKPPPQKTGKLCSYSSRIGSACSETEKITVSWATGVSQRGKRRSIQSKEDLLE